ncbi:non-ribosomal peptide synthetase [Nonomuraea sp. K274]|uniref:Non-ribosomal peptide synthetase n=1 Tax=Nonomuraea cypriaca TaxID=1187855 RepID=A0A931A1J6_9ACTN|nr:non-ribosomal peptide synthetase [Nonomuraea cypriaca]MBF8184497.1 non-ribosomal peptide synthetase [Nonomuraea cypriaca]
MTTTPLTLPADLVRLLADRHGTSPAAIARAVVLLVLSRLTWEDDPLGGDPTFDELVHRDNADGVPFTLSGGHDAGHAGHMELATDLIDATAAARLPELCVIALESAARNPARPVRRIDLLPPRERERVLHEFNDHEFNHNAAPFARDAGVHELVQAQAARTPDAFAVVSGAAALTYRELNGRANQLARHLRERGIERGALVGVCLERGPELVIAVLAVMKAGAAYVPLDPDYPPRRLAFMARDAGLSLVITSSELRDRTSETALMLLDEGWPAGPDTDLPPVAGPADLAYVMYTSGSSGRPKGVMVEHRSICRLVDGNWYADVTADDVVAQTGNFSFDVFTFECWGALCSGARLAIMSGDTVLDAQGLKEAVRRHGVSTMWLTASLFNRHVVDCPDLFAGMKTVLYGGEAVDRSIADSLMAGPWAPAVLVNGYGPTEATTFTTCHRVRQDGLPTMPIGRPIANTEVYVMDRYGGLAPIGVPGELWVGGPGVARGYWNRPELTAERFVDHPFTPGARAYRTGDLVRWLPTGELEFLGRIDQQVKIRGFRIELQEIESVLTSHDDVKAAVVAVREDIPGDKRLVAYYVAADPVDGLPDWCRRTLPAYMVPGAFVRVDSFPLTPNGKLDRAALPAPGTARPFEPPRNQVEKTVAKIWAEVFDLPQVGISDNFFELGGHSLLATQVMSRIRRELGVEVRIRMILDAPTVAGLAEQVSAAKPATPSITPRRAR